MSGINYEKVHLNKNFLEVTRHIKRFYRTLGKWGYYGLIASVLLVSCIQEAAGNLKYAPATQVFTRTHASELCELESKALNSNQEPSCVPQLASGIFFDWRWILNSTNSINFSNPLKKTTPYWEQNKSESY